MGFRGAVYVYLEGVRTSRGKKCVDIEHRACVRLGLFDDPLLGNAAVLLLCERDELHRHGRRVDVWGGPFEGTTNLRSRHEIQR